MGTSRQRKSLANKARRFFRRTTLAVAFTGAAGCAGNHINTNLKAVPSSCAQTSDFEAMTRELPAVSSALDIMARLPLTGEDIYATINDHENKILSCTYKTSEETKEVLGYYQNKRVMIDNVTGTSVVFHEYFHAVQGTGNGLDERYALTFKDAVIACLLTEATAAAYELIAWKEAENNGLPFIQGQGQTFAESGWGRQIFDNAYYRSWNGNEGMDLETRQAKALEAGGQEIVRYLLNGEDRQWRSFYLNNIRHDIKNGFINNDHEKDWWYEGMRYNIYMKQGYVSSKISLIPEEFLGEDADRKIGEYFKKTGLKASKPFSLPTWGKTTASIPLP